MAARLEAFESLGPTSPPHAKGTWLQLPYAKGHTELVAYCCSEFIENRYTSVLGNLNLKGYP